MKKISILVIVFSSIIFSQFNRNNPSVKKSPPFLFNRIFYSEFYVGNQDSGKAFFMYKIPVNRLLFEKTENIYKAKFRVAVEIFDNLDNIIQREFDEKSVEAETYKGTKSNSIFVDGIIPILFSKKIKKIQPMFSDVYSHREFKGKRFVLNNTKIGKVFLTPIVVSKQTMDYNGSEAYQLANFGGNFPFSEDKYELLLPVKDPETDELFVKIMKDGKTIISTSINDSFYGNLDFKYSEDKILLVKGDSDKNYKFFILANTESKLHEGPFKIVISKTSDFKDSFTYKKRVTWFDKPFSLRNPELAIKNLKYIEKDSVIDDMLDKESFRYSKILQKYWKKYDPTPETAFNPIMKEYYDRIDYSMQNFSPISRKNGANTDRGKIYIKYGKPNEIKRTSNTYGQVTEIWIYKKVNKEFVFVDKYGIGDFSLVTG